MQRRTMFGSLVAGAMALVGVKQANGESQYPFADLVAKLDKSYIPRKMDLIGYKMPLRDSNGWVCVIGNLFLYQNFIPTRTHDGERGWVLVGRIMQWNGERFSAADDRSWERCLDAATKRGFVSFRSPRPELADGRIVLPKPDPSRPVCYDLEFTHTEHPDAHCYRWLRQVVHEKA